MWNALRSDLTEFVSAVKEDTTTALNQMDDDFDKEVEPTPEEVEALRRTRLRETYTAPLKTEDTDPAEAARVDQFLARFSVDSKTDDMIRLIEEYPDTIKKYLDELVPDEMEYEVFWQRYYYRCDVDQIAREWGNEPEEQGPINAIGSLIGGAVKAVSASLAEDDDGEQIKDGSTAAKAAASIFQGARPPFVMNTAVSEDDDEEEEELGWGDDDDDEEEDEGSEEQIVFNDANTERLQEELKQALEERDLLQQTVHLQSKEIAAIKKSEEVHSKDEVDKLKIKLFEMESELAAVKSSHLDNSREAPTEGPDPALVEAKKSLSEANEKIAEITSVLGSSKVTIDKLQAENAQLEAKLAALKSPVGTPSELEGKLAELGATVQLLSTEKAGLEESLQATKAASQSSISQLQEALAAAKAEAVKAKSDLEPTATEAAAAKRRVAELEKELVDIESTLRAKEELVTKLKGEVAAARTSPDSISTGVKVESPVAAKLPATADDEEDDWGDDWGEDSESAP